MSKMPVFPGKITNHFNHWENLNLNEKLQSKDTDTNTKKEMSELLDTYFKLPILKRFQEAIVD